MLFASSSSLGIEWNQSGRAHGLLRATLMRPAAGVESIRLRVDGEAHEVDLSALPGDAERIPVNIHTHLLADGPCRLEIELRHAGGRLSSGRQEFVIDNPGELATKVRGSLRGQRVPLAYAGPCDAGRYDFADADLRPWFDREDAQEVLAGWIAEGRVSAHDGERLRGFLRDGFMLLPGLIEDGLVDRALADMQQAVDQGYQGYRYGDSTRLEQLHVNFPAMRALWLHAEIHRLLGLIYGEPSQPCQSLGYVFGSQQDAHQDTIHLTPFPAGYMCGVWIALEDVRPGSGELMVYPGSHRLPRIYLKDVDCPKVGDDWSRFGATVVKRWEQLVADSGIQPQPYLAKRGDVLIWHENLMHAGSVRRDPSLSRRSLVTHNFARGSLVFYDSTGLAGFTYDRQTLA